MSVIMPVYNREKYVAASIESVLNQDYSNFELIIVDDCSTDQSVKIIEAFKDERIKLIQHDVNKGVTGARNTGMRVANGEFLMSQDSDDLSLPSRISILLKIFEVKPDIDVLVASHIEFGESIHREVIKSFSNEQIRTSWPFIQLVSPFYMARRNRLIELDCYFYDEDIKVVDDYSWYTSLHENIRIESVPNILCMYRCHEDQLSGHIYTISPKRYTDELSIRKKMLNKLGIPFSDEELTLHNDIFSNKYSTITEQLFLNILQWFERIIKYNNRKELLNTHYLLDLLEKKIIELLELSGKFDEGLYVLFAESNLSKVINIFNIKANIETFDHIINLSGPIYVFGAKKTSYYLATNLLNKAYNFQGFIDNNTDLHDQKLLGLNIQAIKEIPLQQDTNILLGILAESSRDSVKATIISYFGNKHVNIYDLNNLIKS